MTRSDNRRKLFISLMIDAATPEAEIEAYKKAFPTCKTVKSAMTSIGRLRNIAEIREAIDTGKRTREEELQQAQKEERIRIAKDKVANEAEIDAKLSEIALGTHTRKRKIPVYNRDNKKFEIISIEEEPTETDIVAAANLLYRRKGSFAPMAIKHEAGDGLVEFLKTVQKTSNPKISNGISKRGDK